MTEGHDLSVLDRRVCKTRDNCWLIARGFSALTWKPVLFLKNLDRTGHISHPEGKGTTNWPTIQPGRERRAKPFFMGKEKTPAPAYSWQSTHPLSVLSNSNKYRPCRRDPLVSIYSIKRTWHSSSKQTGPRIWDMASSRAHMPRAKPEATTAKK